MKGAGSAVNLQDAFVQVLELGDYSVSYRIAGFLTDVKHLITAKSDLKKRVLDTLHAAGVEIVSPSFMNQRQIQSGRKFIPTVRVEEEKTNLADDVPDDIIFDKAETAEGREKLKEEQSDIQLKQDELEILIKSASEQEKPKLEREIANLNKQAEKLSARFEESNKITDADKD